jgi:hypothetical protein
MNLAEMLCYADIAELKRIADAYDCPSSSHSKNELIQTILSTIQRRDIMESRVGQISGSDLRFLNSLVFENRSAYSLEELKARALEPDAPRTGQTAGHSVAVTIPVAPAASEGRRKRLRGKQTEEAPPPPGPEEKARMSISRFKNYGWLFNGFSQQTRTLFQVPEDVKSRLCEALERRYQASLLHLDEPQAYRDERSLLAGDVVHFLRYVREQDIPITSEGVMYKRQLAQAMERLSVEEALPTRAGWRFGYGRHFRDYPDRFSLLYDFVHYEGYIAELAEGRLTLTPEGLAIANGLVKPDPAQMYRFWLRLYKGAIPNLVSLAQWVSRLSGQWVTIASLSQVLLPLIRPYYYDEPKDILDKRILRMLMHLGVLRWGKTDDGIEAIEVTPQGRTLVAGQKLSFEDAIRFEGSSG